MNSLGTTVRKLVSRPSVLIALTAVWALEFFQLRQLTSYIDKIHEEQHQQLSDPSAAAHIHIVVHQLLHVNTHTLRTALSTSLEILAKGWLAPEMLSEEYTFEQGESINEHMTAVATHVPTIFEEPESDDEYQFASMPSAYRMWRVQLNTAYGPEAGDKNEGLKSDGPVRSKNLTGRSPACGLEIHLESWYRYISSKIRHEYHEEQKVDPVEPIDVLPACATNGSDC
ncbi:hypothetical protein Mp_2g26020 [Marchantia polymorpha subsp. ruderalis]|uniref:Uncharacterized protein n=1 Tax=Marchantia polymorpha TaxID=3197 RepID=A0A2R6XB96_MARPO|nr:hypothetical protein MARPO_0025s0076 [Marchantia polymorpha]PTQ43386.1 hypothetical protein MARPO_0025s0076 [Marchantia polymorpha]BBN03746.1 hypothetical protein Mp_2g26020 [Marchantia polymorpha subsp. ruderalis]BBN03747.1 hypothetical protein Mp_2g26020 [Marchantia polymorpha subsp. ruderalis]|eukprot:PTQ43385.1 hypothetical protein MARPO_0025s0076 [Marchantia polymorpha]